MEAKKEFTNNQYCVYIVGIRDKLFARSWDWGREGGKDDKIVQAKSGWKSKKKVSKMKNVTEAGA